jgi:hypothetical protein
MHVEHIWDLVRTPAAADGEGRPSTASAMEICAEMQIDPAPGGLPLLPGRPSTLLAASEQQCTATPAEVIGGEAVAAENSSAVLEARKNDEQAASRFAGSGRRD